VLFSLLLCFVTYPGFAASMEETVSDCMKIVQGFSQVTEGSIPLSVLRSANGIAFLRVQKWGFFVSVRSGEGVVIARLPQRGWSGPSAIRTSGAGFGIQVGGQVTEFVVLLNTEAAVQAFARGGNVKFGGALSVAAGPIGHTVEAGTFPVAAAFTYSRSQGLFAGVSLEATTLFPQSDKNASYFRGSVTPEEILNGSVAPPPNAKELIETLNQY
jgi:lipid-binding SYLF domain-containing protein